MTRVYISEINEKWYAYAGNAEKNQVQSIGSDVVHDGNGIGWFGPFNSRGVLYVSSPSNTRAAAYARARRFAKFAGVEYGGKVALY